MADEVVDRLRDAAVPLDSPVPGTGLADLEPLTDALAGRQVVGLGEATHGTREFFQLKHRLVRLLVERLGFRAFALEAAFAEALAVNDYVLRGEGDPGEALAGLGFWTWNTEAVLALVEWLRAFNEGRAPDDRVRFYGFDVQHSAGAAQAVREYLADVDPGHLDAVGADLAALADGDLDGDPDGIEAERIDDAERLVASLAERLEANRERYVAASSEREWTLARRHLRVLEQVADLRRLDPWDDPEPYVACRDEHMAENVRWLREFTGERLALWAHDEHVMTGETTDDDWEGSVPAMGAHLRDALGDDYYALGFDFGRGEFQAILDTEEHEEGDGEEYEPGLQAFQVDRFDAMDDGGDGARGGLPDVPLRVAMHRLGESPVFLDFDRAADAGLGDWLAREHRTRSIGATFSPERDAAEYYRRTRLSGAFDGLLWVAEGSRAVPVDDG